ncbi:MAG: hypothetical protein Hyperionvirus28_34 [Hyperionvirus sp.]|uniref:Ankyrin repeat protein n=1 Tax=Hyperionvirus sp. TaxID=2487770 RepID=A0A3G5ABE5_9VIRU|nr:MAG: hypothetical protein Hyperionvirus28_34 [Hyperionvirus sp.]
MPPKLSWKVPGNDFVRYLGDDWPKLSNGYEEKKPVVEISIEKRNYDIEDGDDMMMIMEKLNGAIISGESKHVESIYDLLIENRESFMEANQKAPIEDTASFQNVYYNVVDKLESIEILELLDSFGLNFDLDYYKRCLKRAVETCKLDFVIYLIQLDIFPLEPDENFYSEYYKNLIETACGKKKSCLTGDEESWIDLLSIIPRMQMILPKRKHVSIIENSLRKNLVEQVFVKGYKYLRLDTGLFLDIIPLACENGFFDIVRFLVDEVIMSAPFQGYMFWSFGLQEGLMAACKIGSLQIVDYLTTKLTYHHGIEACLEICVQNQYVDLVDLFLSKFNKSFVLDKKYVEKYINGSKNILRVLCLYRRGLDLESLKWFKMNKFLLHTDMLMTVFFDHFKISVLIDIILDYC